MNKWLDLEMPIFAYICILTRYLCLPIFIKFLNVNDLQFQGQRFELNTLSSAYVKSIVFVGTAQTTRRTIPITTMSKGVRLCQGVFLSEMKHVAVSPITFVRACVRVRTCTCVLTTRLVVLCLLTSLNTHIC